MQENQESLNGKLNNESIGPLPKEFKCILDKKINSGIISVFKKTTQRFFIFDSVNRQISYKETEADPKIKKIYSIKNLISYAPNIPKNDNLLKKFLFGFRVITRERQYFLFTNEKDIYNNCIRMLNYIFYKKDIFDYKVKSNNENLKEIQSEEENKKLDKKNQNINKDSNFSFNNLKLKNTEDSDLKKKDNKYKQNSENLYDNKDNSNLKKKKNLKTNSSIEIENNDKGKDMIFISDSDSELERVKNNSDYEIKIKEIQNDKKCKINNNLIFKRNLDAKKGKDKESDEESEIQNQDYNSENLDGKVNSEKQYDNKQFSGDLEYNCNKNKDIENSRNSSINNNNSDKNALKNKKVYDENSMIKTKKIDKKTKEIFKGFLKKKVKFLVENMHIIHEPKIKKEEKKEEEKLQNSPEEIKKEKNEEKIKNRNFNNKIINIVKEIFKKPLCEKEKDTKLKKKKELNKKAEKDSINKQSNNEREAEGKSDQQENKLEETSYLFDIKLKNDKYICIRKPVIKQQILFEKNRNQKNINDLNENRFKTEENSQIQLDLKKNEIKDENINSNEKDKNNENEKFQVNSEIEEIRKYELYNRKKEKDVKFVHLTKEFLSKKLNVKVENSIILEDISLRDFDLNTKDKIKSNNDDSYNSYNSKILDNDKNNYEKQESLISDLSLNISDISMNTYNNEEENRLNNSMSDYSMRSISYKSNRSQIMDLDLSLDVIKNKEEFKENNFNMKNIEEYNNNSIIRNSSITKSIDNKMKRKNSGNGKIKFDSNEENIFAKQYDIIDDENLNNMALFNKNIKQSFSKLNNKQTKEIYEEDKKLFSNYYEDWN